MRYFNTLKFQIIMQKALRNYHAGETSRTYTTISHELAARSRTKKTLGVSKLSAFARAKLPLLGSPAAGTERIANYGDTIKEKDTARNLWDFLTTKGEITKAIGAYPERENKRHLFSEHELATMLMCFFDANEAKIDKLVNRGLTKPDGEERRWYFYKKSLRIKGHVQKSEITFSSERFEYIDVLDHHYSSGRFDDVGLPYKNKSPGIAFDRSGVLWIFLRDRLSAQPRVIALDDLRSADSRGLMGTLGNQELQLLRGHILESRQLSKSVGFAPSPAILLSEEYDKACIKAEYDGPKPPYSEPDVYPYTKNARTKYDEQKGATPFHIPEVVIKHLTGKSTGYRQT